MSQQNIPMPTPPTPIVPLPNSDQHQTLEPHLIPPELDREEFAAAESKARHELALFEHQARLKSRAEYPLEPLPRALSNIRSVKRTRFARKELNRILKEKILEKTQRNSELDELIEIERRRYLEIKKKYEQLQNMQDPDPQTVQEDQQSTQQVMEEFIKRINDEDGDTPNTAQPTLQRPAPHPTFNQPFDDDLANDFLGFQPFANSSDGENDVVQDCEPMLDPRCLLGPLPDLLEDIEDNRLTRELQLFQEDPENHNPETHDPENGGLFIEEPEAPTHQHVF